MKTFWIRLIGVSLAATMLTVPVLPQDSGTGKKRPGGGSGGSGSGGSGGSRDSRPKSDPPPSRRDDPPRDQRRDDPPREQRRNDPPRNEPPRNEPPRSEPPRDQGRGDQGRDSGAGKGRPRDGGSVPGTPGTPGNQGTPGRPGVPGGSTGGVGDRGRERPVNPDTRNGSGGRIDNRGSQNGDRGLEKRPPSRTGSQNYGTNNNVINRIGRGERVEPVRIDRAPTSFSGSLEAKVRNQERVSLVNRGYRTGYYHYNRDWRDDYFSFSHYVFDPFGFDSRVYCSPWYYYPSLPAYVSSRRVTIINIGFNAWSGTRYNYVRYDRDRDDWGWDSDSRWRNRSEIDDTLDDLIRAFEDGDRRSIGDLVPRRDRVNIYLDGRYNYSLEPDDFYDMLVDAVESTDTRRYDIVEVRTRRDSARVIARHEYRDPWGRRSEVYHTYHLNYERGGFVIRDFGTSNYRPSGW